MPFWMREATLQIGSKVYQMDDLYFEFEVPFEDSDTLQSATFRAYNLAESTRKGIKRGSAIILTPAMRGTLGPSSWERFRPAPTSMIKRTG